MALLSLQPGLCCSSSSSSPATASGRPWRPHSSSVHVTRMSSFASAWGPSICSHSGGNLESSGRRSVRARVGGGSAAPGSFLTMEEAGLVEMATLDMHEKFLCRLTISSLNLLRVIAEQEGVAVEELNAGRVCDWFQKDKAKRETDFESATLKWESSEW